MRPLLPELPNSQDYCGKRGRWKQQRFFVTLNHCMHRYSRALVICKWLVHSIDYLCLPPCSASQHTPPRRSGQSRWMAGPLDCLSNNHPSFSPFPGELWFYSLSWELSAWSWTELLQGRVESWLVKTNHSNPLPLQWHVTQFLSMDIMWRLLGALGNVLLALTKSMPLRMLMFWCLELWQPSLSSEGKVKGQVLAADIKSLDVFDPWNWF